MPAHPASDPHPDEDRPADPAAPWMSPALLRALAAHPEQMADLVHALRRRVHDEDSLLDLMGRASREAVRLITDTDWAGVTAQFAGRPFTAAHTDDQVLIVDEGQYGQGDGPCLTAVRTDRQVAMTIENVRGRWPHLAAVADGVGVRSFLAEPLHAGERAVGSLNMYSAHADGFRTTDPDVLTVLTEYLNRGLTDFSATRPGQAEALDLQRVLRSHRVVNYATGILMAAQNLTSAEAVDLLRLKADRDGVPLHQAAEEVIGDHAAGLSEPPPDASA